MVDYPELPQVEIDKRTVTRHLRLAGVPSRTLGSIATKALRTARKTTGEHATNRAQRWSLVDTHPQYGTELQCKLIYVKLCAQILCFDNAPNFQHEIKGHLERGYLGHAIAPNSFRDSLLLERFDFNQLVHEGLNPQHGHSGFHIGHEDPTLVPKHQADNVGWRSLRSNLIQGNMTLRQARIYFVKLIGRYFELGEIDIN